MTSTIRKMRLARKCSMEELAARANLSRQQIQRLETGQTQSTRHLSALAKAFGVSPAALVEENLTDGLREDAHPFDAHCKPPLSLRALGAHHALMTARSNVLDRIDIRAGDTLAVDMSPEAVANLRALDPVVAQLADPDSGEAVTIIRQFVPPSLLISNSKSENALAIDIEKADVAIMGVIRFAIASLEKK